MARAETPAARAVRFYRADESIRCTAGHRLRETAGHIEHGWARCSMHTRQFGGVAVDCGEYLYIRHFGDGWVGVARIDWREALHMQKLQMTVDEAAAYLHITWHRGAA